MGQPRFVCVFDHIAVALAPVAGGTIALLAVLITIDIIGRDVFGISMQGTDEIGAMCLVSWARSAWR